MEFEPDGELETIDVPSFEEARSSKGIRGHRSEKKIKVLKDEVRKAIARLGGGVERFIKGKFHGESVRDGYIVRFNLKGHPGEIKVAALPIEKKRTDYKRDKALKQALFTVRDIFEAQYNLKLLSPGSNPLLPYLLADGGETVAELYESNYRIPRLSREAEMSEVDESEYEVGS